MGSPSVLTVICARAGSKGLPGKNQVYLNKTPIVLYSMWAGWNSKLTTKIVLSTDSADMAEMAKVYGLYPQSLRPHCFSMDTTPIEHALLYALAEQVAVNRETFDIVVLLQCSNPIRRPEHIDACIQGLIDTPCAESAATIHKVTHNHPDLLYRHYNDHYYLERYNNSEAYRRQDREELYALNGACYAVRTKALIEKMRVVCHDRLIGMLIPEEYGHDIHTAMDVPIAEAILSYLGIDKEVISFFGRTYKIG